MWPRILVVAALLVIAAVVARWVLSDVGKDGPEPPAQRIASATFLCDAGRRIDATFYVGARKPAPARGRPPSPGGSVHLELSDGRSFDLPQTLSGDGARYADADESLVFWNRGNGALVTANGKQDYSDCIAVAPDPGGLPGEYAGTIDAGRGDARARFSIRYPEGYSVVAPYAYEALGPGRAIHGVKLAISPALAAGTNLSADSYISVEAVPRTDSCTASRFLAPGTTASAVLDSGATYSVAKAVEAAAGNRYEETVYALLGTDPCIAVRYFVHYGVIENYPAASVREFDRQALISQFDAVRRTLTVLR